MAETTYLAAVSHLTGDVSSPDNALGAPDGVFTTDGNTANTWTSRWAMATLAGSIDPSAHLQTLILRLRKGTNTNDPSVTALRVLQSGTDITGNLLATAHVITATGAGADLGVTFAGHLLNGIAGVSVEVVTAANGGGPSARNAVELDAITWTLVHDTGFARDGAVALAGMGAASAAGLRSRVATCGLAASGSAAASAFVSFNRQAGAVLPASSAVASLAVRARTGIAALVASSEVFAEAVRGFLLPRGTQGSDTRITEDGGTRLTDVFRAYTFEPAGAALAGASTTLATAMRAAVATTALTASAVFAAEARVTQRSAVELAANSAMLVAAERGATALAVLDGAGSLAPVAQRATQAMVACTAQGVITSAALRESLAQTELLGATQLAADGLIVFNRIGAAALAGTANFAAAATRIMPVAVMFSANGAVAADAFVARQGAVQLTATGSKLVAADRGVTTFAFLGGVSAQTAAGERFVPAGAMLKGMGLLAGAPTAQYLTTTSLLGTGELVAFPEGETPGAAVLAATSTLETDPTAFGIGSAGLSGVGGLFANGSVSSIIAGMVALDGASIATSQGFQTASGGATLHNPSDLIAEASRIRSGAANLAATGSKLSVIYRRAYALVGLVGDGVLATNAALPERGATVLTGASTCLGNATRQQHAAADLAATGATLAALTSTALAGAELTANGGISSAALRVVPGAAEHIGHSQLEAGSIVAVFAAAQLLGIAALMADGALPFEGGIYAKADGVWRPVIPYFATGADLIRAVQSGQIRVTEPGDVRALSETEWFEPRAVYVKQAGLWLRSY